MSLSGAARDPPTVRPPRSDWMEAPKVISWLDAYRGRQLGTARYARHLAVPEVSLDVILLCFRH